MSDLLTSGGFPDCQFLRILEEKVGEKHDIEFDFLGKLRDFRERVSQEVCHINELFPEYTPHDERYHLTGLFHVADALLTENMLKEMHLTELFVLAVSLYGHDWGMAIGKDEKEYILTGKPPRGVDLSELWILPDEFERVRRFAGQQMLDIGDDGYLQRMSIEMWREYVRWTHATRSSERVQRFFAPIDGGIADAASRVCESHWLSLDELQNPNTYPVNFGVRHETANLRALAVYLRLSDLFDFADDRTPYVMWKFVSPRDTRSKMEWNKHRALRPITCPSYQDGRIVQVDGGTNNPEVYAALEDLRIYCEQQLRGCTDILARMNDSRHGLNLYHIDWRIATRGFKPVSISFEFDRKRMFEILSDEIYQGDAYVFLRELLQNSVDAIRMRREVLRRREHPSSDFGEIYVCVNHGENGDAVITFRDNGIGMDEYVIKNYLAMAGKSYYTSTDFERQGLKMDPISRFGVGILSCFMVADRIEIETYKDPYLQPRGEPLKIVIPAVDRRFRVAIEPQDVPSVGTTVRIFVDGRKVADRHKDKSKNRLDVTGYLSVIAGFVEFPIVVVERARKTVILHPNGDIEKARVAYGEDCQIHKIQLAYPWEEALLPQDLSLARTLFREVRLDIDSDLGLEEYEGALTYLVPKEEAVYVWPSDGGTIPGVAVARRGEPEHSEKILRFASGWGYWQGLRYISMSRSADHFRAYAVYRNGILIPRARAPKIRGRNAGKHVGVLPVPHLAVNLKKSQAPGTNLARTNLLYQKERWDSSLIERFTRNVCDRSLRHLLEMDPAERLYAMGRLVGMHGLSVERLWEIFPHQHWPMAFLDAGGKITAKEWWELRTESVTTFPEAPEPKFLGKELSELIQSRWLRRKNYSGLMTKWQGESCVPIWDWVGSLSIACAGDVCRTALRKTHVASRVRFLEPCWRDDLPLAQGILVPVPVSEKASDAKAALEMAIEDPGALSPSDQLLLETEYGSSWLDWELVLEFAPPFEHYFAYGWELLNKKHRLTQILMRIEAGIELAKISGGTLPGDVLGRLEDALGDLEPDKQGISWDDWMIALHHVLSLATDLGLVSNTEVKKVSVSQEDFIPGSLVSGGSGLVMPDDDDLSPDPEVRGFGLPIKDIVSR